MDVRKEIMAYITTNQNSGALLLTGTWGCGKTYLIRQLERELNNGTEYVLITTSLFGVDSVDSLKQLVKEKLLYTQILGKNASNLQKTLHGIKDRISPLATVLKDYSKIAQGLNTAFSINLHDFINIENEVVCYQNNEKIKKKLVLVFDDFERCKINVVDLLGAINEYSENKQIKTIIVADEEHISNENYGEFKEKVISRTIKLSSDFDVIIDAIVSEYKETANGYAVFLKENLCMLLQVFHESGQENLRTFKSFILDFERVYSAWISSDVPVVYMPLVIYAYGAIHFESKANNYIKHEKYGYMFAETKIKDKYSKLIVSYQLEALQDWAVEGIWCEEKFLHDLRIKFLPEEVPDYQVFLNWDFWDLDDDIISKGLPEALSLAYSGKLSSMNLVDLLRRIQVLEENHIPLPCTIDYVKMRDGFSERESAIKAGKIKPQKNGKFIMPEDVRKMDQEAQNLYSAIERLEDRVEAYRARLLYIDFLKSPYSIDASKLKNQCLISFDVELRDLFFEAYKKANNSEKRNLFHILHSFTFDYRYTSTENDIQETCENLNILINMLLELQKTEADSFTRFIIAETARSIQELSDNLLDRHIS